MPNVHQIHRIPVAYRTGGSACHPGFLVPTEPSFFADEQHHIDHAKGALTFEIQK